MFSFGISKSTCWNSWYQSTYIIDIFTKSSCTLDKVDKNEFNLTEKYVWATYDPHNGFSTKLTFDVNRLRFLLFTKSSDSKLRNLSQTKEALQLHILHSGYTAGGIYGATLQPIDQRPSLVEQGWKYFKDIRFVADQCSAYEVNLNGYFFSCTCKRLYKGYKCVKEEVYQVLQFVVACVSQHGKITYSILESMFIHMQGHIQNPVKHLQQSFSAKIVND